MKTGIEMKGQKDLMSWLSKHSEDVKTDVKKIVFKTGNNIRTDWMRNLSRAVKATTKSKQSIQQTITKGGYGGEVYSGLDHLMYIEYGTKPHDIYPKHKKVLANVKTGQIWWKTLKTGQGKPVKHPGTQPKPCLTPAAHKHLTKMTNDLLALMRSNK